MDELVPTIESANVSRGVAVVVAIVNVDEPPPFTDPGENVHEVFNGQPMTLNPTAWLNPPDGVTVTAKVPDLPRLMVRLAGDTAIAKSGTGTGFTFNVTIVDCTGDPVESVAVMVTGNEPVVAPVVVVIVSVDDHDPLLKDAGENVPFAPPDNPLTVKLPEPT